MDTPITAGSPQLHRSGEVPSRPKILPGQDFMKTLKSRVAESVPVELQRATSGTYVKAAVVLSWYLLSYAALFFSTNAVLSVFLCVSMGLATAAIGFNVFHDSVHGSFSYHRSVNRFWAFVSCTLLGPSHFIWKHKHNFLHHQFPNIQDWDDDLDTRGGLRLSPSQPWLAKFRYQHIYAPAIYALTTIEWLFVRDFVRYFSGRMNESQKLPTMKASDHLEFWVSKLIYFAVFVALPASYFPLPVFLTGFLIVHAVTSVVLAAVFQLAHVMEESRFPLPGADGIEMTWPQLQFATTVNFAPTNKLLGWYCGGLNYQVEHHLLPGVCHAHYKKLAPIVKATAEEFGYPYYSLSTHWDAIKNHYRILKRFSQPDAVASQHTH